MLLINPLKWLGITRRGTNKPNCYLFSNKTILTTFILLLVYLVTMEILLLSHLKHRGPYRIVNVPHPNTTSKTGSAEPAKTMFNPLPVKKIMIADATMFIRSPIAELVESAFSFSELFPFISANMVSFFHNVLSVVSIRFLSHDSLFWRQFGVCLFQFRNFLDSFDGVIYRAHAKRFAYASNYGTLGYFVDAVSDTLGGFCLIIALLIYFNKHAPSRTRSSSTSECSDNNNSILSESDNKAVTSCFNALQELITQTTTSSSQSLKKPILEDSSYLYNQLHSESPTIDMDSDRECERINHVRATRQQVFATLALLGLRIGISAIFWDRSVKNYQDLVDTVPSSMAQQQLQVSISESNLTIIIWILWRQLNALTLQDILLAAVFVDKTWEFIVRSHYIGWILLLGLVVITELHVAAISSILAVSYLYN